MVDFEDLLAREFLGQAWMKEDKKERAPNICLITERFNDVSRENTEVERKYKKGADQEFS